MLFCNSLLFGIYLARIRAVQIFSTFRRQTFIRNELIIKTEARNRDIFTEIKGEFIG